MQVQFEHFPFSNATDKCTFQRAGIITRQNSLCARWMTTFIKCLYNFPVNRSAIIIGKSSCIRCAVAGNARLWRCMCVCGGGGLPQRRTVVLAVAQIYIVSGTTSIVMCLERKRQRTIVMEMNEFWTGMYSFECNCCLKFQLNYTVYVTEVRSNIQF